METINAWDFDNQLVIREIDTYPQPAYKDLVAESLNAHPFLLWQESLGRSDTAKLQDLKSRQANLFKLRLGVFKGDELVAACFTSQSSHFEVMMNLSFVRPEFRGRGIYSALVSKTLELTKLAGFQSVLSYHLMTNNPVLIAKLKLGFTIYGFESHAVHGTLLKMAYHHNELINRSQKFRAGQLFSMTEEELVENYGAPVV